MLEPALAVGRGLVLRPQEGLLLQLGPLGEEHAVPILLTSATREATVVAEQAGGLMLEPLEDESPHQLWQVVQCTGAAAVVHCTDWCTVATLHQVVPQGSMAAARSVAPCHLSYLLPEFLGCWSLKCSVTVSTSGHASYYCEVGWGPEATRAFSSSRTAAAWLSSPCGTAAPGRWRCGTAPGC